MKTFRLGDIVEISSSKRIMMSEYTSHGIPFFRSKEIINLHQNKKIQTELFISEERFNEINEKFGSPSHGDILLTSVGTLGIPYQVKEGDKFYFKDGNLTWFRNFSDKLNKSYLYYWLTSQIAKRKIDEITIGSTQRALTIISLKGIEIDIPSLKDQIKIVELLDAIQKKVELNHKMNETLEEIAKTLFKSWFVDFDPVKAKIEGRSTGLSKEISDLFPNSFEETNDIKIPKSWKFAKFGDLVEPKRGKVITKSKIEIGEVPVVAGGIKPPYYHSKANVKSPVVTISASGNAGYINLYYQDIWASDCSYINRDITNFIYFSHSFLKINQDKIYHLRHGAVQQHINPKDLMGLEILIPSKNLIMEYEKKVTVIHEKISNSNNEIEILLKLKNTILPKLISGELKITYIDKEMTKERP